MEVSPFIFMNTLSKKFIYTAFFLIILLAAALRLYQLSQIPPSLSWDEAAAGYNAWTIANFGQDEGGRNFPLFFKSFEDDKHPVHIYITAVSVKILGLSEFSTRLPAAIFGVLNVLIIFFLGRMLFKSSGIGLLAAFILAISPYNLHFSHFNHEFNIAVFFFMLGLWMFLAGINRKSYLLSLSFFSFGISLISYHSSKIVVTLLILLLVILFFKKLRQLKKQFLLGIGILSFFIGIILFNPELLGIARMKQTAFSPKEIQSTQGYKMTQNELVGKVDIIFHQYLTHFSPEFLFISGDRNSRLSAQSSGEFYKIEALFLFLGLIILVRKRSKVSLLLLAWALLGPVPSALAKEAPHAGRAMFMTGSWHLIIALGFAFLINLAHKLPLKIVIIAGGLLLYGIFLKENLTYYYGEYGNRYAVDWQYGMRQIVDYIKRHPEFSQVYMTDVRSQPYIFFLYYFKILPDDFQKTVKYNDTQSRSYNLVSVFDKYHFGDWDPIESIPFPNVLYVISPSHYNGLRYKNSFTNAELVKFPNGTDAFYMVSKY
ncbi:MAG: Glycosyl transferase family 39 [Candidatus Daviesbacteria bacterium GW2011_GWA1_41_61]|nr:MAG: Glycosyl transferase family 39 [Candidatus Daviesbacteria bacterium GW2011_GWC1_40_9]KKR93006.1 MAG: Glycosyl transferase family 39 [Candidatus Daviesbacteria bacterium GW2011_GWB1_41_15]KKS15550.1 MAG: Glycosyl transferase family 39 [Candidatus Daviesbacteria bacterium GW2011_GWA1_41_61]